MTTLRRAATLCVPIAMVLCLLAGASCGPQAESRAPDAEGQAAAAEVTGILGGLSEEAAAPGERGLASGDRSRPPQAGTRETT